MVKKIGIGFLFWLMTLSVFSQNLLAYTTLSTDNAYIGQPVQLKISVFTTTWFTKGVDIGNIQVDGALTVYFRSVSNSKLINGKKYAGVDFYYNIFPTEEGILKIPSFDIQVESPKEDDYKGIKRVVKTKPKNIRVKGVPLGYNSNNWLVASSLNISEKWSAPLTDIKVGDVIQRTIIRSTGGTLAEFIPATQWDSIPGTSIYPKRAQVKTNKSKTGVSSQRVETVNYLFEKEGVINLPSLTYTYWNSSNKKFYKKQIDSISIKIKPNADLAMLASIKKSLQKEVKGEVEIKDKTFLIFGLTLLEFLKYFGIALIGIYILFKIAKKLVTEYKERHAAYLKSEAYSFKQMLQKLDKKEFIEFTRTSNSWIAKLHDRNSTLQAFVNEYGNEKLKITLKSMNESYFKWNKISELKDFKILSEELIVSRKNYFDTQNRKKENIIKNKGWLNPTSIN